MDWENLSFEGGGAKGYAYVGAIQCLEQHQIYPQQIKRVAGTSIGSLFAVLVSIGCSTEYMVSIFPKDFQVLAKDGSGGRIRSFARAARRGECTRVIGCTSFWAMCCKIKQATEI